MQQGLALAFLLKIFFIKPLGKYVFHAGNAEVSKIQRPLGCLLNPFFGVLFSQIQDAHGGTEALLGMALAVKDPGDQLGRVLPDLMRLRDEPGG